MDVELATSAARHRHHPIVTTLGTISELADQVPLASVCALVMGGGVVARRPDVVNMGARMMAAHVLANVIKRAIKNRVRRIRPEEVVKTGAYAFENGETQGGHDTSFPSGHTAGAVAVAGIVSRDRPDLAVPAVMTAVLIAGVQIPRAKHYPLDVTAGAALGIVSAWLVDRLMPLEDHDPLHLRRNAMSSKATKSVSATFQTREAADRAIEHLVQQHGINRADIHAETVGNENTVGNLPSGADAAKDHESSAPALKGAVRVSAQISPDYRDVVESTFREMEGAVEASR